MAFVKLGSRSIFFLRRGQGEPLVLIPGMSGHHRMWGEALLSGLAADFDVVALDHRGIDQSTDVAGPFTIADLADDVVAAIDALDLPAAHVFGHSMGGAVAQEVVLRHPERVRALLLCSTFAGGEGSSLFAPGPLSMIQAMQAGDPEAAIRAGYLANLSPAYTSDESRYEALNSAALAVQVPVPVVMRQVQAALVHNAVPDLPESPRRRW